MKLGGWHAEGFVKKKGKAILAKAYWVSQCKATLSPAGIPFLGSPLPSKHPGSPGSGKVHAQQGRVLPPGPTITHFLVFLLQTLQQAVMRCGKALKTDINTVILFLKAKHKVNCIYSSLSSNV